MTLDLDPEELQLLLTALGSIPQFPDAKIAELAGKLLAALEGLDPDENDGLRGVNAFESCEDGSLLIYATLPDGDGEMIRVEPHRVSAVLAACGDALAHKESTR